MTRPLCFALAVCALAPTLAAQAPPTPVLGCAQLPRALDYGDYGGFLPYPLDIPLEQALQAMLTEDRDVVYDSVVLLRARQRADSALLPLLYAITEQARCQTAADALLLALEASGAPSSYFLELPDRYPSEYGKRFGINAVLSTLGVRGDTLVAKAIFERYGGPGPDGRVSNGGADGGGVGTYVRMTRNDREFSGMSSEAQSRWVLGKVAGFAFHADYDSLVEAPDDETAQEWAAGFAEYPIAASDRYEEGWARRRLVTLVAEAPEVVASILPSVLDSLVTAAQTPPTPQEAEVLRIVGYEWKMPSALVLDVSRASARQDIERTVTTFELPALYIPGPGGATVPQCDNLDATVYVAAGTIVGGPDAGAPFAGTLRGTNQSDVLVGTDGPDTVEAGNGADTVCGLGGDDTLSGDNGRDTLFGGPGDDALFGGNGPDTLLGGPGTDTADGGRGPDVCDAETETACEDDPE